MNGLRYLPSQFPRSLRPLARAPELPIALYAPLPYNSSRCPDRATSVTFALRFAVKRAITPTLISISSYLYDFNLLYEFSRLVVDPKYEGYKFSRFSGYRNAKRVLPDDRLEIESVSIESPIAIIAIDTTPYSAGVRFRAANAVAIQLMTCAGHRSAAVNAMPLKRKASDRGAFLVT